MSVTTMSEQNNAPTVPTTNAANNVPTQSPTATVPNAPQSPNVPQQTPPQTVPTAPPAPAAAPTATPPAPATETAPATPTATQPNANAMVVERRVNTANLLEVAKTVLTHIGHPAHHSEMQEVAKALFGVDKDIATPVWSDTRNPKGTNDFVFYGRSVYGLKAWGDPSLPFPQTTKDGRVLEAPRFTKEQALAFVPTRAAAKNNGALSVPQLEAKVARLNTELTATLAELEKAKADPTRQTTQANPKESKDSTATATAPRAPSRAEVEAAKDAAVLSTLPPTRTRPAGNKIPSAPAATSAPAPGSNKVTAPAAPAAPQANKLPTPMPPAPAAPKPPTA